MAKLKAILGRAHGFLSAHPVLVRAAVKLRNQANSVVTTYFSKLSISSDSRANGEYMLAEHVAPDSQNFVDVGANEGEWSAHFLRHMRQPGPGLLYEPGIACVGRLKRRFAGNQALVVRNVALADWNGTTDLFESTDDTRLSSMSADNAVTAIIHAVQVATLDQEMGERGWERLSFLKIDAEGHDFFVSRGARGLLKRRGIDILQFERKSTWNATGITLRGPVNFLAEFGY